MAMKRNPNPQPHNTLPPHPSPQAKLPSYARISQDGVVLTIKVQPRASQNCVDGQYGDALKVRVSAPPVDSAANEAVVLLLSHVFNCSRNQIIMLRGHTSKTKQVLIQRMDLHQLLLHLKKLPI